MRRLLSVLLLCSISFPLLAQEITFTSETTTGNGQLSTVLSWSTSPLADSCTASGGWSGEKGASGSEAVPAVIGSATYVLECTWNDSTALLRWTAPTERTDGSPLTDLAGYNVYFGNASGDYTQTEPLNDPGATSYLVGPLVPGDWFFAVTALDSAGLESVFSAEVHKLIGDEVVTESIGVSINPPKAPSGISVE